MLLIIGPHGGLSWDNTQTMVRHNWAFVRNRLTIDGEATPNKMFDSPHQWETFKCAGRCNGRILPIDIADVDHMSPKSRFTWNIVQQNDMMTVPCFSASQNGHHWQIASIGVVNAYFHNSGQVQSFRFDVRPDAKHVTVALGNRNVIWSIQDLLANNINNLQLLCPPCNRSKGAN